MPRIRGLKPDFFKDEDLATLPFECRILFEGLWCYADKKGRMEDRPKYLKAEIFPYDKINIEKVLNLLAYPNLKDRPKKVFIRRYSFNGCKYIDIPEFLTHQNPHHTEKESIIPEYNGEITVKEPSIECEKKEDTVQIPVQIPVPDTVLEKDRFKNDVPPPLELSSFLFKLIRERKSDFKEPNLKAWAKDVDLMIRLDKRKPKRVREVIEWCQGDVGTADQFGWADNILSAGKLRKQFDKLEFAMVKQQTQPAHRTTTDKVNDCRRSRPHCTGESEKEKFCQMCPVWEKTRKMAI